MKKMLILFLTSVLYLSAVWAEPKPIPYDPKTITNQFADYKVVAEKFKGNIREIESRASDIVQLCIDS